MKTRELPALAERPETGPMKFGSDWTGVFIRGDNAMYFAHAIKIALQFGVQPANLSGDTEGTLSELFQLLKSCSEG